MNIENIEKLESFKFPVVKIPLCIGNNEETNLVGIFEEYNIVAGQYHIEASKCLGNHSSDYVLVANKKLIESALVIIQEMGLKIFKIDTNWTWTNKKRMFISIVIDKSFDLNGDSHNLTLNLYNSYDGSMTFGVDFGSYRMTCSNGMYVETQIMSMRKKHYLDFNPEIVKHQIINAVEKFPQLEDVFNNLKNTNLDETYIETLLKKARKRGLLTKNELILITNDVSLLESQDAYSVYNVFTYLSSHIIKTSFERKVKLNNYIFNHLIK